MMVSLVMHMGITMHQKIDNILYFKKIARGKLYTKEREKGRQCADRLGKKYNNKTLSCLREKIPKSIEEKNAKDLEAANDLVTFYHKAVLL